MDKKRYLQQLRWLSLKDTSAVGDKDMDEQARGHGESSELHPIDDHDNGLDTDRA